MEPQDEIECGRRVFPSKWEFSGMESRNWWNRLFNALETEASIPPDRKYQVLQTIFPKRLLSKILSILSVEDLDKSEAIKAELTGASDLGHLSDSQIKAEDKDSKTSKSGKISKTLKSVETEKSSQLPLKRVGKRNPYLKFFRTRADRAKIWYPLPPLSLEEMQLVQKADAITEMIATEFVEWLKDMGGEAAPTLNVPTIISMFEIGFNTHAARSTFVRMKETPTITEAMAIKKNLPHMGKRASLHRQIQRDIEASRKVPKKIAFGKALPPYMQLSVPKADDIAKKWLEFDRAPKKLATMQTVWEGITHLRSTRAFCEWLVDHPEIPPPKFLVESNMLDLKILHGRRYSVDSEDHSPDYAIIDESQEPIKIT